GGSLGIAIATTLVDRRSQFHQSRLVEHVRPTNPMYERWVDYFAQTRVVRGGVSAFVGHQEGVALVANMVRRQARVMAYLDVFWVFWIMSLAALPLILLM